MFALFYLLYLRDFLVFIFINYLKFMKEKFKQIFILSGFIALIILGLIWFSNRSAVKTPAAIGTNNGGSLTVEESNYDFGTISMAKGKVSREFALENKSGINVEIGEVFTSCMCTSAELRVGDKFAGPFGMPGHGIIASAGLIVAPNNKLIVKAIFDPAAHGPAGVGSIERQINVYTSSGKNPVVLKFKAVVTP